MFENCLVRIVNSSLVGSRSETLLKLKINFVTIYFALCLCSRHRQASTRLNFLLLNNCVAESYVRFLMCYRLTGTAFLTIRQEMRFRNKLVEYLTDWCMGNSHQIAPPAAGTGTACPFTHSCTVDTSRGFSYLIQLFLSTLLQCRPRQTIPEVL